MQRGVSLRIILIIHAMATCAAGVVLIIAPEIIPQTVGITLEPSAYILSYFLGAAEIAIAFLSYAATRLTDMTALRFILWSFIIFHALSAAVEILAFAQGLDRTILVNVVFRLVVTGIFTSYALRR